MNKWILSVSLTTLLLLLEVQRANTFRSAKPPDRGTRLRTCNKSEQIHEVEGIQGHISDANSSCHEVNFLLKDFTPSGRQVAKIRYECSGIFQLLRLPEGRRCSRWTAQSRGCYLYVNNNSVDDCVSHLNVSGCRTVVKQDNTPLKVYFKHNELILHTFRINFTLIQCTERSFISSGRSLDFSPFNVIPVKMDSAVITGGEVPTTIYMESTETQSRVSRGIAIEISLSTVAAVLLLGIAIGLGCAYRRKKRKSSELQVTRSRSVTDEQTGSAHYQTCMTSTSAIAYENSDAAQQGHNSVMTPPHENLYVEPASLPSTSASKQHVANTCTEATYANSQPFERVATAEDGYVRAIPRAFVDGESGYQYPVKESLSESGYLELEFPDKS